MKDKEIKLKAKHDECLAYGRRRKLRMSVYVRLAFGWKTGVKRYA